MRPQVTLGPIQFRRPVPTRPSRRIRVQSHAARIAEDLRRGRRTRWTPDTLSEAWQALCWRNPWARVLNDLGGALVIGAVILFVIYAAITPVVNVNR